MNIHFKHNEKTFQADLSKPLRIAIPLKSGTDAPNCFYAPLMEISPVVAGDFIGSTAEGGLVNFKNIRLNPHGNGTHTECVGHIAKEHYSINKNLNDFHYIAKLVSIFPVKQENGDRVILRSQIEEILEKEEVSTLIIRTLPNNEDKLIRNYSGTNPPYLDHEAVEYMVECGIDHLLLDLPSVDREIDEGKLLAHRAFWQYPQAVRTHATITEMIFVPDSIRDDYYLLNIQIAPFEIDVSPSNPVLYKIEEAIRPKG